MAVLGQVFQLATQYGERRAQFVRGIRHKLFRAVDGVFEAADHEVQCHRQALELVPGSHHRQTLAQVVLSDDGSLLRKVVDGFQSAAHEHKASGNGYGHGDREAYRQHEEYLADGFLGPRGRDANLYNITKRGCPGIGYRGNEHRPFRQAFLAKKGTLSGQAGRRNGGGIEAAVVRISRGVHNMTITAGDADEALVRLRGVELLDFPGHGALARPAHSGNQRIGDLTSTPRLGIEDVGFEVLAQQDDGQRAQENEHQGQHAGVPGHQAEAQRAGVHDSVASTSP